MSIGARIRQRRDALGKSQLWLSEQLGVQRSAVTQWESGASRPDTGRLTALARALESSEEWLMFGREPAPPSPAGNELPLEEPVVSEADFTRVKQISPVVDMPDRVPVYGTAAGGDGGGDFHLNGEIVDRVRRPPGLAGAPGIFGIYVIGDSCSPKYESGELIFVHPGRPAVPGCWVLLELHSADEAERNGPALVKKLLRRTADKVVLQQLNPPKEITVPLRRVKQILRVLTNAELFGV